VTTGVALAAEAGGSAKPLTGTRQSLIYLPAETYLGPHHFGKATAVGEVGLVAIARDGDPKDAPACGPYAVTGSASGGGNGGMAPRKLIDIEVDVYDTATGDKLTTKKFEGDYDECPMIATSTNGVWEVIESRPDEKVVNRWLTKIAEKGAIP
jgi:hypothetical protein